MNQILRLEKVLINIKKEVEETEKLKDIIYRVETEKEDKKKFEELELKLRNRLSTRFVFTHMLISEIVHYHQNGQ